MDAPVPPGSDDQQMIERYLEHVRVEKRLAARTVELYALDLRKLADFAAQAGVGLTQVHSAHVRRWIAQMHGGGRSGRGIALILSGWRGFYAGWGAKGECPAIRCRMCVRPRWPSPCPRP
jgi:integrase/recombinase XerC